MLAETIRLDSGFLWTVAAALFIICAVVWLIRAFR